MVEKGPLDTDDKDNGDTSQVDNFLKLKFEKEDEDAPSIITKEKLDCYVKFASVPIIVEGPELSQDYSYFLYFSPILKHF